MHLFKDTALQLRVTNQQLNTRHFGQIVNFNTRYFGKIVNLDNKTIFNFGQFCVESENFKGTTHFCVKIM
jgi:hypothetical protein